MKKYYNPQGKVVGTLKEKVYTFKRYSVKHYFVVGGGYPISCSIIEQLKKDGCDCVKLIEITKKGVNMRVAPLDKYDNQKAFRVGGFDEQKCCPLKDMYIL